MLRRTGLLLLPLLAAPAVWAQTGGQESIWLRGRGSDVWIERGGQARESREGEKKGLTRLAPPAPRAASDASQRDASLRVLTHLEASYGTPAEDAFAPRFYIPGPVYRGAPAHTPVGWIPYGGCEEASHPNVGHGFHPAYPWADPWRHSGPRAWRHGGHASPHRFHHRSRHTGTWGLPAYRDAGPFGGTARSGGFVQRGGAYRKMR